jgi:hypothetical protein
MVRISTGHVAMARSLQSDNDALRFARAATRENDVKSGVAFQVTGGWAGAGRGEILDIDRREQQGGSCDRKDVVDTPLGQCGVQRGIWPARFDHPKEGDEHFRLTMSEDCDRGAIITQALCQTDGKCIRARAQLAVAYDSITTNVCNRSRRDPAPVIDPFD